MIANVAGRAGTIPSKIRPLNNTSTGEGAFYVKNFLKKGKILSVDSYPGNTGDNYGYFGKDAGTYWEGNFIKGNFRYSMMPLNQSDWTEDKR